MSKVPQDSKIYRLSHHRLRHRLTVKDIELVSKRTFSTQQWIEQIGSSTYGISSRFAIQRRCATEIAARKSSAVTAQRLPNKWTAIRHGYRYYIFYASDLQITEPSNKFSEENLLIIKEAISRGLKLGDQMRLARQLNCSESHISRTIARLRRQPRSRQQNVVNISKEPFLRFGLESKLVEAVFNRLLTVKEWSDYVGKVEYGISDLTYVYQMCAGRLNGQEGYRLYPARLPDNWHSVRMGDSWLLYHRSLGLRSRWIK